MTTKEEVDLRIYNLVLEGVISLIEAVELRSRVFNMLEEKEEIANE